MQPCFVYICKYYCLVNFCYKMLVLSAKTHHHRHDYCWNCICSYTLQIYNNNNNNTQANTQKFVTSIDEWFIITQSYSSCHIILEHSSRCCTLVTRIYLQWITQMFIFHQKLCVHIKKEECKRYDDQFHEIVIHYYLSVSEMGIGFVVVVVEPRCTHIFRGYNVINQSRNVRVVVPIFWHDHILLLLYSREECEMWNADWTYNYKAKRGADKAWYRLICCSVSGFLLLDKSRFCNRKVWLNYKLHISFE